MGAPAAAIALRRAERHVVEHLRRDGATRPDRATPLPDLRHIQRRRLQRLLNAQVVHETPAGYWLDEAMYRSFQSDRRNLALLILAIVVATALGMAVTKLF